MYDSTGSGTGRKRFSAFHDKIIQREDIRFLNFFTLTNKEFFSKNIAWEIQFSVYLLQIKKIDD